MDDILWLLQLALRDLEAAAAAQAARRSESIFAARLLA
jgi:hypothetical protein